MSLEYQLTPIARNTSKLYTPYPSGTPTEFADATYDVVRASMATEANADGFLQEVDDNVPRLDYSAGGCPVLLTEEERTNELPYSNDFDGDWTESGTATITPNTDIAPDGNQTASTLSNATDALWTSNGLQREVATVTASTQYVNSIWVKSKGATIGEIAFRDNSSGDYVSQSFVPTSEWQRVFVTRELGAGVSPKLAIIVGGTDGDLLVWEGQVEEGFTPSSNIYTNGAPLTRNKDEVTGSQAVFNSVEGNIQTTFSMFKNALSNILSISDGGGLSNRVEINSPAGDTDNIVIFLENPSNTKLFTYPIDNTQENTISVEWGIGRIGFRVNGIEVYQTESFITFTANALTDVQYANVTGTSAFFFGRSKGIDVYSDDEFYNPKFTSFNQMATTAKYTID